MITVGSATEARLGALEHEVEGMIRPPDHFFDPEDTEDVSDLRLVMQRLVRWMIEGYQRANATDLASAVAFQALVAVVPMFLLLISVAGLFLQDGRVLQQAILTIAWVLPSSASNDAFTAAFEARRNSGLFGALSLLGFAWVGTGFVSAMARSMNRIYGVPNAGYLKEKQRGFIVILLFALFFLISVAASVVPTFFVANAGDLPVVFRRWVLASGQGQLLSYALAVVAAYGLFVTIFRLVPNAKQRMPDVWPGAVISSLLFLLVTQAFPIYLRMVGGANRYGLVLGLISLMVIAFYALAHVILFGTYVNATWQRHRDAMRRQKRRDPRRDTTPRPPGPAAAQDPQAVRADTMEHVIR
ncbi:MAG TPA: YihY/virulence factor BrkB family protein [Thermomicrobiales bacterium]|nr:YihY/virulence factor BrkB family protein [Thermomicrobiales bacterium]